jgi:hypothetical protein
MKNLALIHKPLACCGALALTLCLGARSASAFQVAAPAAKPAITSAASATSRPGLANLTPTAPVSPQVRTSLEGDIRDIRQPRHVPKHQPWVAVAVGVILFAAFAAWRWLRSGKFLQILPHEIAVQYLEEVRRLMDPDHAREYCFAVSNIIRRYVEERFHVQAPKLTTEEFLRDLVEAQDTMLEPHRALLGEFLQHCDLAKFAGWRYSMPDLEAMHDSARSFVQQTANPERGHSCPHQAPNRDVPTLFPGPGERSHVDADRSVRAPMVRPTSTRCNC